MRAPSSGRAPGWFRRVLEGVRGAGPAMALDSSLAAAVPEWQAGRRAALEGMVAELVGPTYASHALRCAGLSDLLAEQLALTPDEAAQVTLAAALHVLPAAFPPSEDACGELCAFPASSLLTAAEALGRIADAEAARMAAESCERWDGAGLPHRLAHEHISMGGRIVAAACSFDHASAEGLDAGLEAIRGGSGSAFDPVVAAELIHLFREPWQRRVAA